MKRILKFFSAIAGILSLVMIVAAFIINDFDLEIKENMVKEKTDEYIPFPIDKDKFTLTITKLNVSFNDSGKKGEAQGDVEFKVETLGRYVTATSTISTGIDYRNSSFYLLDPKFTDFAIKETVYPESDKAILDKVVLFGEKHKEKVNHFLNGAKNLLSKNNEKDNKKPDIDFLDKEFLKKTSIETLKANISNFPIYTLNGNAKEVAASMILKDVYFKEGTAFVTLSVSKFVGQFFLYLIAGILAVMAGLAQLFLILSGRASIGITDLA